MSDPSEQPTETVEQVYEYQPTDENNLPIGGKQVIKYHTLDELHTKLTEQNVLLLRKLRQKTRNERLGIVESDVIPEEASKFVGPVDFTPQELSPDEYTQLAADLADPTKAAAARKRLFEAEMGASSDVVTRTLRELQEKVLASEAVAEANAFQLETPDYYPCQQNAEAIAAYVARYDLAPTKSNYAFAFKKLNEIDPPVLIPRPTASVTPATPVVPVEAPRERIAVPSGIATGLTRESAADEGFVASAHIGDEITYQVPRNGQLVTLTGIEAINAMPGDVYGRLLRDKNFQKKVEALYAAAAVTKKR